MIKVVSFIKGYVKISVEGFFGERFLNLMNTANVPMWDIEKINGTCIFLKIKIEDFKKVRKIARKTKSKIKIKERTGLPFFLHRYKARRFSLVAIVICIVIAVYYNTHFMGITVRGTERIPEREIIDELKTLGVHKGMPIKELDRVKIKNEMMVLDDDIAWIGINPKGSRLYIDVTERKEKEGVIDDTVACDIVAGHKGVIKDLRIREGQTVVRVNDAVEEGDLLVSGVIDSMKVGMRNVHARGEVFAETYYKEKDSFFLREIVPKETGRKQKVTFLEYKGNKVQLSGKKGLKYPDGNCRIIRKDYEILGIFPIAVIEYEYRETEKVEVVKSEKETIEKGIEELKERIKSQLGVNTEIKDIKSDYVIKNKNEIEITVEFCCFEDIALEKYTEKIDFKSKNGGIDNENQGKNEKKSP